MNLNLTHDLGLYSCPRIMSPDFVLRHHMAILAAKAPADFLLQLRFRTGFRREGFSREGSSRKGLSSIGNDLGHQSSALGCTLMQSSSPPTGPSRRQRKRMQMITRRRPRWVRAIVWLGYGGGGLPLPRLERDEPPARCGPSSHRLYYLSLALIYRPTLGASLARTLVTLSNPILS